MAPHQPDGIAWPENGILTADVAQGDVGRDLSLYVHIPFCAVRCGYCDFNTYTVGFGMGADTATYDDSVLREIDFAADAMTRMGLSRKASTVFFGGGTPTMLDPVQLARILRRISSTIGLYPGAEVTVEANPESVDASSLRLLADAGFTRVSFGMQSAIPHVLETLDRTHRPQRVPEVVQWAKDAGLEVSVDLIYGSPGESLEDWQRSLDAAVELGTDHISAYALVIEEGTKMATQVARGVLPMPDPDDEAMKYEMTDATLGAAGFDWYEISNFARRVDGDPQADGYPRHASRHNLAYWHDNDWWGFGPGAHSHIGSARWWNVKHPSAYASRVQAGVSPAQAGEYLDAESRDFEAVLLGIRTSVGIEIPTDCSPETVSHLVEDGYVSSSAAARGRLILTLKGRLLADYVTRQIS